MVAGRRGPRAADRSIGGHRRPARPARPGPRRPPADGGSRAGAHRLAGPARPRARDRTVMRLVQGSRIPYHSGQVSPEIAPYPTLRRSMDYELSHLRTIEAESIHIMREVAAEF